MLAARNRAVERLLDPGEHLVLAWRLDGRLTALTDRRLFRLERKWRSPRRGAELELDLPLSEGPSRVIFFARIDGKARIVIAERLGRP